LVDQTSFVFAINIQALQFEILYLTLAIADHCGQSNSVFIWVNFLIENPQMVLAPLA
jgi:hypothetical protein